MAASSISTQKTSLFKNPFSRLFGLIIFSLAASSFYGTYILLIEEPLSMAQKQKLFALVLEGEPPGIFYSTEPLDLLDECRKHAPSLHLQWIPPMVWQIAALHAFFHDPAVHNGILSCAGSCRDSLSYDEKIHPLLASASRMEEIINFFNLHSQSLPNLCPLFFQINEWAASLYRRAGESDQNMMDLAIRELPPFSEWPQRGFPFWSSPWIDNSHAAQMFYDALTNPCLMSDLLKIEHLAHEKGEWVMYRGYEGSGSPSTLHSETRESHALSFGSTLLGGTFFSLSACALIYSQPNPLYPATNLFLALRVLPEEFTEFFRAGPLHPFLQLLADGEMFHAHTKIAASQPDEYKHTQLKGYFMKCNQYCCDSVGYLLNLHMNPETFEQEFQKICKKSGRLIDVQ